MNDLVNFFKVLSDPTRFEILTLLLSREMCVCELVDQLKLSQSLISHHLYHLKVADLVHVRREGTWIFYSVNSARLNRYKLDFLQELQKASETKIPCKFDCCKAQTDKEKTRLPDTEIDRTAEQRSTVKD
jgi:ArsR family transcriptional regulator